MLRCIPTVFACLVVGSCMLGCTSYVTSPITDSNGNAVVDSIASLEQIELGGVKQWILIRGNNAKNPILLKIHGGPGQAEMATAGSNRLLEKDFVVVEWDQRGAGKSSASVDPRGDMNMKQIVSDTVEVTQHLLKRFNQETLILVGHSWGSAIGLQAIQRRPDLYQAFVSTGQMTNFSQAMVVGYRLLMQHASKRGDTASLAKLQALGAPPYIGPEGAAKRDAYVALLEKSGNFWHAQAKFDRVGWMISAVEYSWPEKLRYPRAAETSFDLLMPDLLKLDMTTAVPRVEVPVYFAVGRHDLLAPPEVSLAYFSALVAPKKEWVWFEGSAHFPQWEQIEQFHELLTVRVLRGSQNPRSE